MPHRTKNKRNFRIMISGLAQETDVSPLALIQALHQQPDQPREDAGKNGEDNGSAPRVPAFELRNGDIIVNATRLEQYHQKKRHHEANDAPFQSPKNGIDH